MASERYKIIKTTEHKKWLAGCPMKIEKSQLVLDIYNKKVILQLKLYNLSDKIIRSVFLDIDCYDDSMDFLVTTNEHMLVIDAAPQSYFGDKHPIVLKSSKTANVEIFISKIAFSDGTTWRNTEKNQGIDLPEQPVINIQSPLYEQILRECAQGKIKPVYWPIEDELYWRCVCGQPNTKEMRRCGYCKSHKQWLLKHFDEDYLTSANTNFIKAEKTRNAKIQRQLYEKNKKVKRLLAIAAVVSVAAISVLSVGSLTDYKYTYDSYKTKKLINAIKNDDYVVAKSFIEKGSTLNSDKTPLAEAVLHDGKTALILAIENRHNRIIKLLLENGADPNAIFFDKEKNEGKTPLLIAAEQGNIGVALLLVEHGAANISINNANASITAERHGQMDAYYALSRMELLMDKYFKTAVYDKDDNKHDVVSAYTFILFDKQGVAYNVHFVSKNLENKFVLPGEESGRALTGDEMIWGDFQVAIKKCTDEKLYIQGIGLFPDGQENGEFNVSREMVYTASSTDNQPDILVVEQYLASVYSGIKVFYMKNGLLNEVNFKNQDGNLEDYITIYPGHFKNISPLKFKTAVYSNTESAWYYNTWELDSKSATFILIERQIIGVDEPQPVW